MVTNELGPNSGMVAKPFILTHWRAYLRVRELRTRDENAVMCVCRGCGEAVSRMRGLSLLAAVSILSVISLTACAGGAGTSKVFAPPPTYTIGGVVSGLSGSGLVLQNNGSNNLSVDAYGSFAFSAAVASGGVYNVTVLTEPTNPAQICSVANGSGTATANVTNIQVTCTTASVSYTIGGTVSALSGSGLVLQNNGGNNLALSSNGSFTFTAAVAAGTTYNVTVLTQPANPAQTCTVANGSGTANANVTNVSVTCSTTTYTIGGSVLGLSGSGLVLQDNGTDDFTVTGNGTFTFATAVAAGTSYSVSIKTQPTNPTQTCSVSNATGVANANVTNVSVTCTTVAYTIGGTLSGLTSSTIALQNNGGDNLSLSKNGSFVFATAIAASTTYNVTVKTQPTGQTCTVTNASGTANSNVTNVALTKHFLA
jgi:hypothetical protein